MRARLLLTGIALGAAMLAGGAATAQAAPAASSQTNVTSTVRGSWEYIGTGSESWCYSMVASYAGPAYCTTVGGGRYALYVWVE
ncbi:hypothetical protein [Streptomyces sp. NBC_00893]|uniref:hypothetical protein n=1 Tax=Streptomyces sp. NBC_00893 TaxID=2975862 RepID=UPI00224F4806|nr:hypothetical protein [Streptomyces sp. NBC_00893]MCX4851741.1 hypothetical protein [Streptomyces sp. NBC_00893]